MEFEFRKNVKILVDFEIGETVLIECGGYKLDGKRKIESMYVHTNCESGIMAYVSGYDRPLDIGWFTKITKSNFSNPSSLIKTCTVCGTFVFNVDASMCMNGHTVV